MARPRRHARRPTDHPYLNLLEVAEKQPRNPGSRHDLPADAPEADCPCTVIPQTRRRGSRKIYTALSIAVGRHMSAPRLASFIVTNSAIPSACANRHPRREHYTFRPRPDSRLFRAGFGERPKEGCGGSAVTSNPSFSQTAVRSERATAGLTHSPAHRVRLHRGRSGGRFRGGRWYGPGRPSPARRRWRVRRPPERCK